MSVSAGAAKYHERRREMHRQWLDKNVAGRDLVSLALSNPEDIIKVNGLRGAVLGRTAYRGDIDAMVGCITNDQIKKLSYLIGGAADPETHGFPAILDAWKSIVCDVRLIEEGQGLQEAYEAQLREEELQTPAERAREAVRTEDEKKARRNARWFIPCLEPLYTEEVMKLNLQTPDDLTERIWKRESPASPAWIQHIVDTQQSWGFVFYKTHDLEQRYGHKWADTWDQFVQQLSAMPYSFPGERSIAHASLDTLHCAGNRKRLRQLWKQVWPTGYDLPAVGNSEDDDTVRDHFKSYRKPLSSPGILQNTFIVVDGNAVSEDFGWNSVQHFWVWAYDADWEPSSTAEQAEVDEEVYQGRVKVSFYSLDAWFYAARSEGVSLNDMWLKAQRHPLKQWICYSKLLEEWDHEPYI